MTAKEWMNRGWEIKNEIEELKEAKKEALMIACNSSGSSGESVQTSKCNSMERKFTKYAEISKSIDDLETKLLEIMAETMEAIKKIDDSTYRKLLIKRYIRYQSWETIAKDMNYTVRHIYRLNGYALKKMSLYVT